MTLPQAEIERIEADANFCLVVLLPGTAIALLFDWKDDPPITNRHNKPEKF